MIPEQKEYFFSHSEILHWVNLVEVLRQFSDSDSGGTLSQNQKQWS